MKRTGKDGAGMNEDLGDRTRDMAIREGTDGWDPYGSKCNCIP